MTTTVALLRGVNVGRNKRIAMADLRALLADLGYTDVRTLLQSGNAVVSLAGKGSGRVAQEIEAGIAQRFKLEVKVVVRTRDELAAVIAANPFGDGESQGSRLLVMFLSATPDPGRIVDVEPPADQLDRFCAREREIYLWCPNGVLGSKLPGVFSEARLGVTTTTRNWNTVTKLLALADS